MRALGYDKNNTSNSNIAAMLCNIDQSTSSDNMKQSLPNLKILALKEAIYNQLQYENTPSNISLTSSQPNILGIRHMSAQSPSKAIIDKMLLKMSHSNLKQRRDNSDGR